MCLRKLRFSIGFSTNDSRFEAIVDEIICFQPPNCTLVPVSLKNKPLVLALLYFNVSCFNK